VASSKHMSAGLVPSRKSISVLLIAVGAAMIVVASVLFALMATGAIGGPGGRSGSGTVTGFGSVLNAATPSTAATPPAQASTTPLERLVISSVNIDAPVVVKGLDENRVMQSPDNAYDVAWYDFSARPGEGSNAVFSGHVDYVNVGPAVFWRLKDLQPGDRIDVRFADSVTLAYAVTAINTFDAATAPIDQIVAPTPTDSLTLITCTGQFNRSTRQYDQRLIVRAERV